MVKFADDIITRLSPSWMKGVVGVGGFVHTSKFTSFMMLKIVVCIGSDCIENFFGLLGLGCRWGPGDVDICPDGGAWAVGARCGIRREQYVKESCRGVGVGMEQWFDSHGCGWVKVSGLCKNGR